MKSICCLLVLTLVTAAQTQAPEITPDTPVDSSVLRQWLHGSDPRLIAWAADFGRRRHDGQLLAEIPGVIDSSPTVPEFGGNDAQAAQRRAMFAMLDALVQENTQVPIRTIEAIAPSFPAQAAILISRYPLSESRSALDTWAIGNTGNRWAATALARIASMMLAKDPRSSTTFVDYDSRSFVAGVVAASENNLQITISAKEGVGSGIGGGVGCGDSFGGPLTPGWPQVYFYALEEHTSDRLTGANASLVIELDEDQIVAKRWKENAGWGSCFGVEPPNPVTRHRLIAYWLGVRDRDMTWHPVDTSTIVWSNESAYKRQLGTIIEAQRRKLRETVDQLRQRGLLNEDEARKSTPKLVITIQCAMNPCPLSGVEENVSASQ